MESFQRFIFEEVQMDPANGLITLRYSLDGRVSFVEKLTLPPFNISAAQSESLRSSLAALHLIGGISYYKTFLPPEIVVQSTQLTGDQAAFWDDVYINGLGEFLYKNRLSPSRIARFPSGSSSTEKKPPMSRTARKAKRVLVPIGGGKDSVVTVELLRNAGYDITLLRVGSHPVITKLAQAMNLPLLEVSRSLSPELFKLNEQGAYNGHVPITAYLSFLAIVIAQLYDFDAVVWSAERSANIGNVQYEGREINHQWSKSIAFERAFSRYIDGYTTEVSSFSLLRPLSELHITKIFAKYPQYFSLATSCNKNWKILQDASARENKNLWCGACPKCAFVFALYAATMPRETVDGIFGKDLFADPSLLKLYRELVGTEGIKPFECVGTPEETKAALLLAAQKNAWAGTPVMEYFENSVAPSLPDTQSLLSTVFSPSSDHVIPDSFLHALSTL